MKLLAKTGFAAVTLIAVAMVALAVTSKPAEARPGYKKAFEKTYPKVKADCNICHDKAKPMDKKLRNDYGKALDEALGEENVKDAKKVQKALKEVEGKDSKVEGKTYGDLLKSGKRPAE